MKIPYYVYPGIAGVTKMRAQDIIALGCAALNITPETLKRKCRERPVVRKRQVMTYLLCEHTSLTLTEVGEHTGYVGKQAHSAVSHSRDIASDNGVKDVIELRQQVESIFNFITIKNFKHENETHHPQGS